MSWTDSGAGKSDYDLYIFKNPRSDCSPNDCSTTDGFEAADYQSASGNDPEVASISPLKDGTQKYTIHIVPYTPTGETVNVKIELLPGDAGAAVPGFGGARPVAARRAALHELLRAERHFSAIERWRIQHRL